MTVVRPLSQFGITELDGDGRVGGFQEKPRLDHWVNGGFFVFEPAVLDYLTPRTACSSRSRCERLAAEGKLHGYRHEGFWDCMDTYKDAVDAQRPLGAGSPPWAIWERHRSRRDGGAS